MSATIPYEDNVDESLLKYAPKWIRENARSNREPANQIDSGMSNEGSLPLARLANYIDVLGENVEEERARLGLARAQRRIPIQYLRPNSQNTQRHYSNAELEELAESIRHRGIIQPIVVRKAMELANTYEIIAGERRWRAAQRAGLPDVPIVLLDVGDLEALEISIIENTQRTDPNPLEEAAAYRMLADKYGQGQETIAKIIGKSRSYVANMLRLLELPDEVKDYIHSGKLTAGHARSLVAHAKADELAKQIIERGLTVRQAEALAQHEGTGQVVRAAKTQVEKRGDIVQLEKRFFSVFGMSVKLGRRQNGILQVRYKNFEELEEILSRLENSISSESV